MVFFEQCTPLSAYLSMASHVPVHVTLLIEPPTAEVTGERFLLGVRHQVSLHPTLIREHFPADVALLLAVGEVDKVLDAHTVLHRLVGGVGSAVSFKVRLIFTVLLIIIVQIWFPANKKTC